jgi:type I restriction enzyme S subunit
LRYPYEDAPGLELRARVEHLLQGYINDGLGDGNAEQRLCSQDDAIYWQQFSEVLLADQLTKAGIRPLHSGEGPDFLIEHMGRRIWIEVITPKPEGIPGQWLQPQYKGAWSLPHEEILLRWTSAIKEKAEKLLGNAEKRTKGYLQKGIVRSNDAYVIAINGYLLRRPSWPQLLGISQFPFAVEASFCVGPIQVYIDLETLKTTGSDHQHRPSIPKPNGAQVRADTFLDPQFSPISAIWAVDIDENLLFERTQPMAVVHNPGARNPIPERLLPAQSEYVAIDQGADYLLEKRDGRLNE